MVFLLVGDVTLHLVDVGSPPKYNRIFILPEAYVSQGVELGPPLWGLGCEPHLAQGFATFAAAHVASPWAIIRPPPWGLFRGHGIVVFCRHRMEQLA